MQRYPPLARIWLVLTVLAAVGLSLTGLHASFTALGPWVALAFLALCAAVAHFYPIKSTSDGATYQLTNVFLVAGAIILTPIHLALLVLFALSPQAWRTRQRPGSVIRWLFNIGQATVAAQITHYAVKLIDITAFGDIRTLVALLGAAMIFTLVQNAILGVMASLFFRKPIRQAEPLTPAALLSDGFAGLMGAVVAGQWLSHPYLVALMLPLLVVAHRLTRSAHLAQLAQVDVKTGLHNARHFEQVLEEELAQSQRLRRPLALVFADLDRFKRVNDTYGHAAGDKVLLDLADLLRDVVRQGDLVARFGGEEFVILLPGTGSAEAFYLAERVRQRVEEFPFHLPGGETLSCTISIGLATCPDDGTTVESLLEQADLAMYRAKQTRNAVIRAGALPSVPRLPDGAHGQAAANPAPALSARKQTRRSTIALSAIVVAGAWAALGSLAAVTWYDQWLQLLPFLLFAVAAEALTFQILENNQQKLTISFTVAATMAAIVAVPAGAPLVSLVAALIHFARNGRQQPRSKVLFNLANPTLSAATAALVFLPVVGRGQFSLGLLLLSLVAVLIFHLTNVGLVAVMIALHSGRAFGQIVREALWSTPVAILLGVTGAFLAGSYQHLGLLGVAIFALPLLTMRFTLGYYSKKSQEAIRTLQAANHEVELAHGEKEQTLRQLIDVVASIIDARDQAVAGHSERVAAYAVALAEELRLPPRERAYLHTAGLLHDLGKIAVPESILHKPAKLTDEEFTIVKEHAVTGERILSEVKPLAGVARMVGDHHERYDGTGYPNRERGTAISLGGRIVAVADTLDSILSDRPYSKGKPLIWALEELHRCSGTHFDPEVIAALDRVVAARGPGFFIPGKAIDIAPTNLIPFATKPSATVSR